MRLRQILIPAEHGSWGFLLELMVVALVLAPSAGGVLLAAAGLAPWLAVIALAVLLARAGAGLTRWRRPAPAKRIGLAELGYGGLTVVLYLVGYLTGW